MSRNQPGWAIYLRVSDEDKQSPERSFAMQRQRIEEQLLVPSDLPISRNYRDILSGTSPDRKEYQQMMKDAEEGRFTHLGLYRADRFGRSAAEGLQAATKLISLGIRMRMANMPSLTPESPDGFFMFLIQMGLAQREVDVMRLRARDGMEAKARAGGWPHKAPEGYVNKERLIKSGKYDRWVEKDPDHWQAIRDAWDLLLTGRFTLEEICEELDRRGYIRATGARWFWHTKKAGKRRHASNRLHKIFHSPFYAGWVVSEKYGIKLGEVRGNWEPMVTTEEFERGIAILREHDANKSRRKRHFYLLRNLLWVSANGRRYKMYGSTPSGRSRSYSYYVTKAKPGGSSVRLPCRKVDSQISGWLAGVAVDPKLLPEIHTVYRDHVDKASVVGYEDEIEELQQHLTKLNNEEARLGRLFMTERITERTYEQLRQEWQEKLRRAKARLTNLRRDASKYLDDLDVALTLMAHLSELYERLSDERQATLLRLLAKRIIVDDAGDIIDHQLNTPFTYLSYLARECATAKTEQGGSTQIPFGPPQARPS